jgi:capsular exopolysaccharide synthesis family protein
MQKYNQNFEEDLDQNINIREQFEKYIIHWRWFILGVFLSLFLAFLYLRYTVPVYNATSTILVKDDRKGSLASELSTFSDLGILGGGKSNVDNEIEVIKSRKLIKKTISELGLNVIYINEGRIKDGEIYNNCPIKILFYNQDPNFYNEFHQFRLISTSSTSFEIFDASELLGTYKYGESIKYLKGNLTVVKNKENLKFNVKDFTFRIEILPIEGLAVSYRSRLKVLTLGKNTSVIELNFVDPIHFKAKDFLNALVKNYNKDGIEDKNFIAENTSKFIEERLRLIYGELEGVEKDAESFKKTNRVTDITSEAGLFLENASEFEKGEIETETQLKVVNTMIDYLKANKAENLIPANILTADVGAAEVINQYNNLVLERNRLLKTAGEKNAIVLAVDKKIESLRYTVSASLQQLKASLKIKKNDLARQNAVVEGRISQIPTQEKEFRIIARQQQVKEALYLYLLEKREETAISLAVTEPNAKVIDDATSSANPVSPNRNLIYLIALVLGGLIPFGIIYLIQLFDNKVKSRLDIERNTTVPFIGDIPVSDNPNEIIQLNSRTNTAEAIRIIRTNLEFLLKDVQEGLAKTIFVTSTFPKEGKTFVSVNLASTIALSEKKVLLIGMDIRNPKIDEYLQVPAVGLTNYISSNKYNSIDELIVKIDKYSNFYVLPAGIIPPNPAELLMDKKVEKLFEELRTKFDYIVVDTAPVSLVTDTLIISHLADVFVYVTRANYLDKRMLKLPQQLYQESKLPNMSILINGTDSEKGYGYGYGYGYGVEVAKKSWWKKLFGK